MWLPLFERLFWLHTYQRSWNRSTVINSRVYFHIFNTELCTRGIFTLKLRVYINMFYMPSIYSQWGNPQYYSLVREYACNTKVSGCVLSHLGRLSLYPLGLCVTRVDNINYEPSIEIPFYKNIEVLIFMCFYYII